MMAEITGQDFDGELLKSDLLVVIDFWAPWCGPCLRLSPLVGKFSEEFKGKLKCCKLSVDESLGAVPESMIRPKLEALL